MFLQFLVALLSPDLRRQIKEACFVAFCTIFLVSKWIWILSATKRKKTDFKFSFFFNSIWARHRYFRFDNTAKQLLVVCETETDDQLILKTARKTNNWAWSIEHRMEWKMECINILLAKRKTDISLHDIDCNGKSFDNTYCIVHWIVYQYISCTFGKRSFDFMIGIFRGKIPLICFIHIYTCYIFATLTFILAKIHFYFVCFV